VGWLAEISAQRIPSGPLLAQALPPVEAFGQLPFITQTELSPDGKHFAGIQTLDGKPAH
jgi:hypothetical protein